MGNPLVFLRVPRTFLCGAAFFLLTPSGLVSAAPRSPKGSHQSRTQAKKVSKPKASHRQSVSSAASSRSQRAPRPIPPAIQALGPLSVGHPSAGFLVNGVRLPESPDYVITMPSHGFGTQETVDALRLCIGKVRRAIPESHPVMLGSVSGERGGRLPPHSSHRTGRDADVYFFRHPGAQWSKAATEEDIDLPRTWALLRCFITETDVDMILIDRKVQNWIEAYALSVGEDPAWIHGMFHDEGRAKTSIVRHVPGHVAHMHVRFTSPRARKRGVAHYDELVAADLLDLEQSAVVHKVVKGDSLSALAHRHKLSVEIIQRLNHLKSTVIRIGQKLTLQQPVDVRGARDGVFMRARYLPPRGSASAQLTASAAHDSLPAESARAGARDEPEARGRTRIAKPPSAPPGPPPQDDAARSPTSAANERRAPSAS